MGTQAHASGLTLSDFRCDLGAHSINDFNFKHCRTEIWFDEFKEETWWGDHYYLLRLTHNKLWVSNANQNTVVSRCLRVQ